jgi:PrtD family type I secretion system ABC transporter
MREMLPNPPQVDVAGMVAARDAALPFARDAQSPLSAAFRSCRSALVSSALFSGVINILMLAAPLYMLQVYDRVLASGSVPTLVALTILVAGIFAFLGVFELIRSRIAARIARHVGEQVHRPLFAAILDHTVRRTPQSQAQPLRDLDLIRHFLTGSGPATLFDLPWTPIYLGVLYLLHPYLGMFALAGVALLACLALLNDLLTRRPLQRSGESSTAAHRVAEECRRNASAIRAMGMLSAMEQRWGAVHDRALADHQLASDRNGAVAAFAKTTRLFLQSAVLAMGAYLVIEQSITAGAIIAASILMTRAASPIEQGISQWRGYSQFRAARHRLKLVLADFHARPEKMALPAPRGHLRVDGLTLAVPGARKPILRNISFALEPGQVVGIIGPTGTGKSSLAKALVNVWQPQSGMIAMDGAPFHQWDAQVLGRAIGYLPQEVELFDGTFDENIARFRPDASADSVIHAAKLAGVHDLILGFPDGYKMQIGETGSRLSAGQRQRVGLARALYGDPVLVVMDEPNANLDPAGDAALSHAIRVLKKRLVSVVIITHRPSAIHAVDVVLGLKDGHQLAFGPKDQVLKRMVGDAGRKRIAANTQPISEQSHG